MSSFSQSRSDEADRRETAARWTVRRDRGLSAAESIEFELWLAADPRHAAAMQRIGGAWSLLDRIPESVAQQTLAQASCRRSFWRRGLVVGSLAAAAALVVLFRGVWPAASVPNLSAPRTPTTLHAAGPSVVTLADGTIVRLNTGGEIVEQFTRAERRVLLARGEAFFEVTKSPARPFIVRAGRVDVRAVGTAFNVNLTSARVEVIVTEGRVGVAMTEVGGPRSEVEGRGSESGGRETEGSNRAEILRPVIAELGAGERAVLLGQSGGEGGGAPAFVVTRVEAAEMARALAWQESLIRLGGATLAEIAAEFERRTGRRVILADPALAGLRLGGRFRADDVDGFVNLMATTLEIDVKRATDGALVLRKKIQIRDSGK